MNRTDQKVAVALQRLEEMRADAAYAGRGNDAAALEAAADELRKARFMERENWHRAEVAEAAIERLGIKEWEPGDGDDRCQRCGRDNPVWYADDATWNAVMPDDGILCPTCFMLAADELLGWPIWHIAAKPSALTVTTKPGDITAALMGEDDD